MNECFFQTAILQVLVHTHGLVIFWEMQLFPQLVYLYSIDFSDTPYSQKTFMLFFFSKEVYKKFDERTCTILIIRSFEKYLCESQDLQ